MGKDDDDNNNNNNNQEIYLFLFNFISTLDKLLNPEKKNTSSCI